MKIFPFALALALMISQTFSISSITIEDSLQRTINFNDDWEFRMEGDEKWKTLDLPHDFSISQDFDLENCDCGSGFLPGGIAYYRKNFTLITPGEASVLAYFYGVYQDSYISINGIPLGVNHYGYNSFAFDISDHVIADGTTVNILEVKVEHEIPNSRWYSGGGIYRDVEIIVTGKLHVALDGLKITTPDIKNGKGTVDVETEVVNELDEDSELRTSIKIKDKFGKVVANYCSEDYTKVSKKSTGVIISTLNVENPLLWSDKEPNLYTLELDLLVGFKKFDHYSATFGFRYFTFDYAKGFVLNGVPTKLNGVCMHHDYGPLGAADYYDASYKRFKELKDMGINSIRTTHNPASKNWIKICNEIGLIVVEEMFDVWATHKGFDSNDFATYFRTPLEKDNLILGNKEGMVWSEFVLKSSIKRDRNEPCIVMWSLGNEISYYGITDDSYPDINKNLIAWTKEIDTTRPTTSGDNDVYKSYHKNEVAMSEETVKNGGFIGLNYAKYDALKEAAEKFGGIYLSESASSVNSRGIYSLIQNGAESYHDGSYHITSYDKSFVNWGSSAHYSLWVTLANDFVAGQYVWTGYDYIGEPTPYDKTRHATKEDPEPNSSYFGIIDTAGFPKDTYYLYRAQLNKDSITVHMVTAWDPKNIYLETEEGKTRTPVDIYTNAPKVELYRNDKTKPICVIRKNIAETKIGHEYYTFETESFDEVCKPVPANSEDKGSELYSEVLVEFLEGTKLFTKAYDNDGNVIDDSLITGRKSIKAPNLSTLRLGVKTNKSTLKADGKSLAYVEVSIVDDEGTLNTKADNLVSFKLNGEGKILGVDNGDQYTTDKLQQKTVLKDSNNASIKVFAGKALVVLSSTKKEGSIKLTVSSEGLEDKVIEISTEK